VNVIINAEVAAALFISNPIIRRRGTIKVPPPIPTREDIIPKINARPVPIKIFLFSPSLTMKPILEKNNMRKAAIKSMTERSKIIILVSTLDARYEPIRAPAIDAKIIG